MSIKTKFGCIVTKGKHGLVKTYKDCVIMKSRVYTMTLAHNILQQLGFHPFSKIPLFRLFSFISPSGHKFSR